MLFRLSQPGALICAFFLTSLIAGFIRESREVFGDMDWTLGGFPWRERAQGVEVGSSVILSVRPDASPQPVCQGCRQTELHVAFPVLSLERLQLVGRVCSQIKCLTLIHLLGLQAKWYTWLSSPLPREGVTLE